MQLHLNKFLKPVKINSLNPKCFVSLVSHSSFCNRINFRFQFSGHENSGKLNSKPNPTCVSWNLFSWNETPVTREEKVRIVEKSFFLHDRPSRSHKFLIDRVLDRSQTRFIGFNLRFLPFASVIQRNTPGIGEPSWKDSDSVYRVD